MATVRCSVFSPAPQRCVFHAQVGDRPPDDVSAEDILLALPYQRHVGRSPGPVSAHRSEDSGGPFSLFPLILSPISVLLWCLIDRVTASSAVFYAVRKPHTACATTGRYPCGRCVLCIQLLQPVSGYQRYTGCHAS